MARKNFKSYLTSYFEISQTYAINPKGRKLGPIQNETVGYRKMIKHVTNIT